MKKYYIVPITTRSVKINDRSLFEMLEFVNKKLYDREKERANITYESENYNYDYINGYNHITSLLYKEKGVPEKIIIVDNGNKKYEFFTEEEVDCDNDSYLKVFRVTPKQVKKYIEKNPLHSKHIFKFIKKGKKDIKVLSKCKNTVNQGK